MKENYQRVYATVDLDAICYNMEQMHGKIASDTKIMGVIKTDGYGHGVFCKGEQRQGKVYKG